MKDTLLGLFFLGLILGLGFTGLHVWAMQLGLSVGEVIFHSL